MMTKRTDDRQEHEKAHSEPDASMIAGIDVGGTNIGVGLVDNDHRVHVRAKTLTPIEGPSAVIDAIASLVESLEATPAAVGLGIPGVVHDGQVLTVPNLANGMRLSTSPRRWSADSVCRWAWPTTPTSDCSASGWRAQPAEHVTYWESGWGPALGGASSSTGTPSTVREGRPERSATSSSNGMAPCVRAGVAAAWKRMRAGDRWRELSNT